MAGTDKEKLISVRGIILERINKEKHNDYGNFSQRLAEKFVDDDVNSEKEFVKIGRELGEDFFNFNEIEEKDKILKHIYSNLKRFR